MTNTCTDVQATLSTYLDAELENTDLREFETHIADCSSCRGSLELVERSHGALRLHLRDTPKASDMLRKRLGNALDQEDAQRHVAQRRQWLSWSLPAAASAVAVAALALFVWNDLNPQSQDLRAQSSQVTRDAARHHLQDQPLFVSSDRGSIAQSAATYLEQPVQAPRFSSTQVRLLGWTPVQLDGKQSATFVYEVMNQQGRHKMNVHAVKRSDIDVRSQSKLRIDGAELWIDSAMGFNTVTYVGSQSLAYVFSSGMSTESLVDLVTNTDIVNMLNQRRQR